MDDVNAQSPATFSSIAQNFAAFSAIVLLFLYIIVNVYVKAYFVEIDSNFDWLVDYTDGPKLIMHAISAKFSGSYLFVFLGAAAAYKHIFNGDYTELRKFIKTQTFVLILLAIIFAIIVYFARIHPTTSEIFLAIFGFMLIPLEIILVYTILLSAHLARSRRYLDALEILMLSIVITTIFALYYAEVFKVSKNLLQN